MKTLRPLFVLATAALLLAGACPQEEYLGQNSSTTVAASAADAPAAEPAQAPAATTPGTELDAAGKTPPPARSTPKQRRPMTDRSRIWLT